MSVGNRSNKGNKRWAIHDKLIVPLNGYCFQEDPPKAMPDQPTSPVGKPLRGLFVYLYEISRTYEGIAVGNIHKIPFTDLVGDPMTDAQIDEGTALTTVQGETLCVKWNASDGEFNGLIVHNESATGTSWYEPNWGNIYGVALEWEAKDGSIAGKNFADRIIGWTQSQPNGSLNRTNRSLSSPKDYAPNAVRPGLMLGNPDPNRTIATMSSGLPILVFPALGKVGQGLIFGFNRNVTDFLRVKPYIPATIRQSGLATARADQWNVNYALNDDPAEQTYVVAEFERGGNLYSSFTPSAGPIAGGEIVISNNAARQGSASGVINWVASVTIDVVMYLKLLEMGTDRLLAGIKVTIYIPAGSMSGTALVEPLTPDPVPGESSGSNGGSTTPNTGNSVTYFCDGTVATGDINTDYWQSVVVRKTFWEGRNDWLNALGSPANKSTVGIAPFHKYLFKFYRDTKAGTVVLPQQTWAEFRTWSQSNLTCLSDIQRASLYMTHRLKVPVTFFSVASGYLNGDILDIISRIVSKTPASTYDWVDFNDVTSDEPKTLTGAFATDIPGYSELKSYINFEPQALQYSVASAVAHRPFDYVIPIGQERGEAVAPYTAYYLPEMTDSNYLPYVAAEVAIHEIGHSVSFSGSDTLGTALHDMPAWLSISGWSSKNDTHLAKTQPGTRANNGKEAPVSDYGCFSPAEDFAEAYRLFVLNPTFLQDFYPQKYAFMQEYVTNL
ncbi:MAG: hypothetical protein K0Q90_2000 [Paenibacillaceae bacterium]|jgi:hypothetical protein|nr:hypothetical protein [Paenibacillaceae bacterium]